jgi:hypothetical protein
MTAGSLGALRTDGLERRRRTTGVALVAFGLVGLVLVVLGLGALARLGPLDAPADAAGVDPMAELRLTLGSSEATLRDAAVSARSAGSGLVEAADAVGSAGTLTTDLASTMRGLADALRISILGAQPFAVVAPAFDAVADRAAALATDLEGVRTTVQVGADDLDALADRLVELGERVERLRESVGRATLGGLEGLESLRLFAIALLAWLAVPAIASLWLGVRRLQRPVADEGNRSAA